MYRVVTLLVAVLGWVLFRSDSLSNAWIMIKAMFGGANGSSSFAGMSVRGYFPFYIAALVLCFPWGKLLRGKCKDGTALMAVRYIILIALFAISTVFVVAGTYNAFIYFNF